jgi:hypothetical protein
VKGQIVEEIDRALGRPIAEVLLCYFISINATRHQKKIPNVDGDFLDTSEGSFQIHTMALHIEVHL